MCKNPKKYLGDHTKVVYRSLWERRFMVFCDSNSSVISWGSEEVVVPYGSGSKLSCDSTSNYFNVWLDGYQPERYYKIEYRVRSGSGTVDEIDQYFDEGFTFKINKQG